jgi:Glycosyl hydrolase family 67 N-terminus
MLIGKKIWKSIVYGMFCLLLGFSINAIANDQLKRNIDIGKKFEFTLIANKQSSCNIVVPEDVSPVVKFAAKELQTFIAKATGVKIPITTQAEKNNYAIILGDNALSRSFGIDVTRLPRDGFIIKTVGKNIIIAGIDDSKRDPTRMLKRGMWDNYYERGTLFGVYDFLERFADCRFFFPGKIGTVVPKRKELIIPRINIVDSPDYISRSYTRNEHWDSGPLSVEKNQQRYLNSYRLRFATDYIPNCHGLNKFDYINRF